MKPPIALLTDFGGFDAYVGVMKAVILARDPDASLIDLCHEVPPQDVRRGAFLLATSLTYFPGGTIFLAVVDPGVGTQRRGLALEAAGWRFVGPDNGLFAWALRFLARDGLLTLESAANRVRPRSRVRVVEIAERSFWFRKVSSTFHGRDIFAPVAAELSMGRALEEFGPVVDDLVDLPWPEPRRAKDGSVEAEVVTVDGYGNLITSLFQTDLPPAPTFQISGREVRGLSTHFDSDAELVALVGSSGLIELAAPNHSAAALLDARPGSPVHVSALLS